METSSSPVLPGGAPGSYPSSAPSGAAPDVLPDVVNISHGGAEPCDLVTVPARQGLEAVDILRRGTAPASVGPVLHDDTCDTLGFLVPPGTADAWDVPGSACTQTSGRGLRLDGLAGLNGLADLSSPGDARRVPAGPAAPAAGTGWLLPPETADPVTDPAVLRAALGEAARLIEAADSCR
ncbi:hypothetical protein [Streptomyces sp. SYSU K217416]